MYFLLDSDELYYLFTIVFLYPGVAGVLKDLYVQYNDDMLEIIQNAIQEIYPDTAEEKITQVLNFNLLKFYQNFKHKIKAIKECEKIPEVVEYESDSIVGKLSESLHLNMSLNKSRAMDEKSQGKKPRRQLQRKPKKRNDEPKSEIQDENQTKPANLRRKKQTDPTIQQDKLSLDHDENERVRKPKQRKTTDITEKKPTEETQAQIEKKPPQEKKKPISNDDEDESSPNEEKPLNNKLEVSTDPETQIEKKRPQEREKKIKKQREKKLSEKDPEEQPQAEDPITIKSASQEKKPEEKNPESAEKTISSESNKKDIQTEKKKKPKKQPEEKTDDKKSPREDPPQNNNEHLSE